MRDLGSVIELILNAQRRIRILEQIDESSDPVGSQLSKLNGRRSGKQKRETLIKKREKETTDSSTPIEENNAEKESKIVYAKTENIVMEPFERTVEIKVINVYRNNILVIFLKSVAEVL